jgi:hypothetical protein
LSDFSTARFLLRPSMVSEKETHRVCAAAIVQDVLRQAAIISANSVLGRIFSASPGVLTGILLTILVVFLIDNVGAESGRRDIVNWDYVGSALGSSVEKVGEEVRQEVHEATAPDNKDTNPYH